MDEVESNRKSEEFVVSIIDGLGTTHKDEKYLGKGLAEVALTAALELKLTPDSLAKNPTRSTLEQFLSDLNVYGLREALAYLFEFLGSVIDESFEEFMIGGYRDIGTRFLRHSQRIKKRLEKTYSEFVDGGCEPVVDMVDRLIVIDAIKFGDPRPDAWADGERQSNFAVSGQ